MFILASQSPRRKELLKNLVSDFLVIPSKSKEMKISDDPYILNYELAKQKAYEIFEKHPEDVILASDTIVILDQEILGKPKDRKEAEKTLKKLSNKTHIVLTSFCIISKYFEFNSFDKTYVTFNELNEPLIQDYVKSGSPLDKAGSYGIQDNDHFPIIKQIKGSLSNVIGLPLEKISPYIKRIKKEHPELFN